MRLGEKRVKALSIELLCDWPEPNTHALSKATGIDTHIPKTLDVASLQQATEDPQHDYLNERSQHPPR